MQPPRLLVNCAILLFSSQLVSCQSGKRVTFGEESSEGEAAIESPQVNTEEHSSFNRTRQGKGILDWIGLGTGRNVDPYLAKVNDACLSGDLAECFKFQALQSFSEFFDKATYNLNEHVRVVRMPADVVAEVNRQPYEYSNEARSGVSEWDQLVNFAARKAEKFVKTVAIEMNISDMGENDVYAPRFLDEIADEVDTLENKKDSLFSRNQFRRVLIPVLILLKLFKVKLLLFLPLILGLASFKKFLAFMAIVIPGLIGFFKLYKPQYYQPPVYNPNGVGYPYYKGGSNSHSYPGSSIHQESDYQGTYHGDAVSFGQDLAYSHYREYQS